MSTSTASQFLIRPDPDIAEMQAFEAHIRTLHGWEDGRGFERSPIVPGMYYNQRLDDMWLGWMARAKHAKAPK